MTFQNTLVPKRDQELARGGDGGRQDTRFAVTPAYEIKESDAAFGLEVFLPGVAKDDLDLSVEGRELTLSASRAWRKPESWNTIWSEMGPSIYRLHLMLPEGLQGDNVHAELKNGVLRLTLPKSESAQRKKIKIE